MYRSLLFVFLCCGLSAWAQPPIDVLHYRFELGLSDQSDAITGKATITVRFLRAASQLTFDLASLDQEKGMIAFRVMEGAQDLVKTHRDDVLTINLAQPAREGETRTFVIDYMGTPKDGLIISSNKYGDRSFFADNWPNRAHNWIPCVDRPDDKASFDFVVTAPDHYQVIANGTPVIDAADAKAIVEKGMKRWHYREAVALPTKVMVIGAARFAIKEFGERPSGIPVSAWVYPQDSTKGFYDYGLAPGILQFFSDYIAPFPYEKLANVQSRTIFGGMENASAIFYAEDLVTGNRKCEDVIAHEIAHQWFGDMASEKSFAHLWLSEGFATYFTDIYFEQRYGTAAAVNRLKKERGEVIAFSKKTTHAVVDSSADLMSLLNANSYQKGGWILHMLRQETGDSLFRRIIQAYYGEYKGSNADTRDFESVAEKISGKDLRWFFDQWLFRPGLPMLALSARRTAPGKVMLNIEQQQPLPFTCTLTIGYVEKDGANFTYRKIVLKEHTTRAEIEVPAHVYKLLIDPKTALLYEGAAEVAVE